MTEPDETRVLIVDDNPLDQQLLYEHLSPRGYRMDFASDGAEAWGVLEENPLRFDVVLLDRSMPRMGGIELLGRIKQHARLRTVPVIMQTASAMRNEILEGIRAGAYYYLTKPYDVEMLLTVVATATRDYGEYKRLQEHVARGLQCLTLMRNATFSIQTIDQARDIAGTLANACPDPFAAVIGLTELLVNAIEHGNLGITYEEKSALNADGSWETEVRRRLTLPENASKHVELRLERANGEVRFTIRDQGRGFDWQRFLDIDPVRAFDNHGRGIAIARTLSFDTIEYRGQGNEVVAHVRLGEHESAETTM